MGRFVLVSLSLLLVTLSLNGIGADHHCPSDWYSYEAFCYKVVKEWKTWKDAEASCEQLQDKSHLASVHSLAETINIRKAIFGSSIRISDIWLGLSNSEGNRNWEWSDGSNFNYTAWELFEPDDDEDENCVKLTSMSRYSKWKISKCESKNFFICKM
uniref:LP-Fur-2 n=1 Tax=Furina ornata TaxID=529697 RepID=R4G2V3_9SAUR